MVRSFFPIHPREKRLRRFFRRNGELTATPWAGPRCPPARRRLQFARRPARAAPGPVGQLRRWLCEIAPPHSAVGEGVGKLLFSVRIARFNSVPSGCRSRHGPVIVWRPRGAQRADAPGGPSGDMSGPTAPLPRLPRAMPGSGIPCRHLSSRVFWRRPESAAWNEREFRCGPRM